MLQTPVEERQRRERRSSVEPNASKSQTWRMLETGQPAPDFAVADETGTTHRLADYAGRTLVLWFYPKADTPG